MGKKNDNNWKEEIKHVFVVNNHYEFTLKKKEQINEYY